MHIGLLGRFRVRRLGQEIRISAAKQRAVLATLAVRADSFVSLESLVDELWGCRPPASAVRTVQTYVYQLRRTLCLAGDRTQPLDNRTALLTSSRGYVLRLGEGSEVDTLRFRLRITNARAELCAGDDDRAVTELRAALDMWSGPAFGEVPMGPTLTAASANLHHMRASAQELLFEAELRRGRHYEIIGELVELAHDDPTQERFSALLMTALHRSGRRAEALRVFHRLRTELRDQLGVPPAQELQRLLTEILSDNLPHQPTHHR